MAGAGTSMLVANLAQSREAPAWWRDAGARHEGRELEGAGRLRALAFPDTLAALACATELQRGQPGTGNSRLRVGIDAGEEDRIDSPQAVAGRLCDRAEPGQVLVSQAAHSLAEARSEHRFREVGALALDGQRSPVRTWELLWGQPEPRTRIRLCGGLELAVDGRGLAALLPAVQAGALLCYLLANREHAHDREALVAVLWPEHPPKEPLAALRPLLSRLRRAISPAVIEGRDRIRVVFPEPIWVDVEEAVRALESARRSARSEAWETAREHAGTALELLSPRFLPAQDAEWVDARRRELEELELEALEWVARSGLELGEPELGGAERASRDLIAQAPYRETGYRFLMEALARSGNVAEALRVYDGLRVLLRDELGTAPAAELQALHQRLLTGERPGSPRRSPLPSLLSPRERSELVGRERELAALRAAWRGSRAGGRRLVLVAGEPGIGKTRLTSELAREAHEEATVLHGACHEQAPLSYLPFVEALRQYVRGAALDWAQLARKPGAGELALLIPELAAALPAEPATRPSDQETRRYLMFEAVSELLTEASTRAPVMLVLDDLHWADPATLHLLRHVMRGPREAALLIVATYRDADIDARHPLAALLADLRRDGLFERISLDGLSERGVAELIASHAGHAAPLGIVATVYEQTAGNPFFVEEVMRHLIETGVLFEREGRWASALTADEIGVPEGVKEVLTSRLGRLSDDCRAALAQAAVLGREFSFDVLCAMGVLDEDALIPALEEAVAAQLIVEADRASAPAYAFTHALVRDTLHGALSSPRRQRLHAAAARAIEQTGPDAPVAELAHHWLCAGDRRRALAATVAAATAADRSHAHDEAMRHYERALELWDAVDEPERHAGIDRVEMGVRAGEAASVLGEPERAARLIEATLQRVDRAHDPMRAGVLAARLGRYRWIGGDTERALMAYEEAVATVPATPPSFERARVLAALAHALIVSNRSEPARARSTEALAIARALEAPVVAGRAMTSLGAATARLEHPDHGLPLLLEARQQLHRAGAELDFLFVTYTLESVVLEDAGRLERAYEAAREGIEFTRAHGMHRNHRGWLEATGASALIKLGRWVEAGELLETALRRGPTGITRRAAQLLRAELQLACGDLAGAAASADDGQRSVRGEQPFAGRLCDVLAALAMAHGDFDAAREHVRHGLEVLAPLDDLHAVARLCWRGLQAEADRAERARTTPEAQDQESAAGVAATLLESARALVTSADAAVRAAELPALRATCEAEFARASGRADPQGWAGAVAAWQALNQPYPRAYCLLRAAESAMAAKRTAPEAAALLAEAGGIASRLGAAPLVASIESLTRVQSASGRTASPA